MNKQAESGKKPFWSKSGKDVDKKDNKPAKAKAKKKRRVRQFFKDMSSELKKISWPDKKEWLTSTVVVLVFVAFMAVVTGLVDLGLSSLMKLIVG